ncbi:MAG: hypothetical protein HC890_10265 [Chloroflexaceae bacterium]|nr:hypothetical protein [Chloroflexaceae bacterium]
MFFRLTHSKFCWFGLFCAIALAGTVTTAQTTQPTTPTEESNSPTQTEETAVPTVKPQENTADGSTTSPTSSPTTPGVGDRRQETSPATTTESPTNSEGGSEGERLQDAPIAPERRPGSLTENLGIEQTPNGSDVIPKPSGDRPQPNLGTDAETAPTEETDASTSKPEGK